MFVNLAIWMFISLSKPRINIFIGVKNIWMNVLVVFCYCLILKLNKRPTLNMHCPGCRRGLWPTNLPAYLMYIFFCNGHRVALVAIVAKQACTICRTLPQTITGLCVTVQSTPCGSRTWTPYWMTTRCCVWPTRSESNSRLLFTWCSRCRIWPWPHQPLSAGNWLAIL